MAKISTYPVDSTPSLSDKLIGTDAEDSNETKNYPLSDIASLINENTQFTSVLAATSTVAQTPSGVGVATTVTFGGATSNPALSLSAGGVVTFNQTGLYLSTDMVVLSVKALQEDTQYSYLDSWLMEFKQDS